MKFSIFCAHLMEFGAVLYGYYWVLRLEMKKLIFTLTSIPSLTGETDPFRVKNIKHE